MNSPSSSPNFRVAVLSVVKHDYLPQSVAAHPRFEPVVVADDASAPDWIHQRNQQFADEYRVPYVRDVEAAVRDYGAQVAVVSSEAERHCGLSLRAAEGGLHIIQDKPMSPWLPECDRLVDAVEKQGVKFLLWNRNYLPAVLQAREWIEAGQIGQIYAAHVDFYFAKDAGPPKGSRAAGDPPLDWLTHQIQAHRDGSDGGVGKQPLGELQVEGIYPLAYLHMLTGAAVRRVFARVASHFHQLHADNQVDDLATLTLEMERGIVGSLCIGRIGAASHPDLGEIKIHLLGDQGGLVISEARPEVAIYHRGQDPAAFRHRRVANDNDFLLVDHFARAIDNDGPTILDARAGRAICATVGAALRSGQSGLPELVL